ncbi:ATP-binding protein [Massilia sp.]|uniref:ATP-binding protein n=1 Tax=Massilia sp. TaxID=1882437 RepID=UPI00391706CC
MLTVATVSPGRSSILFVCRREIADPLLTEVAAELGQTVERAFSLDDALAKIEERDFALILVGYSGDTEGMLAALRGLRGHRRTSHTPLVAIGLPLPAPFAEELLYEAGAIAVLHEPLSPTILRAKARFYIDAFDSQVERRRAELALVQTQARLESIIEAAELGIWTWEIGADRVDADMRMADLFGVPFDARGRAPLSAYLAAIHPDDVGQTQAQIAHAVETNGSYASTYRVRRPGASWRWVIARGHVEHDRDGAARELRGVVIDATRQLEAEQELAATEERYRTVFDSIDEGLCVIDMLYDEAGKPCDYLFVEANPAFIKHTGLVDAVGKTIRQMAPQHEQHWFDIYGRVAETGVPVRFENEASALGRWYDVYATRLGAPEQRRVAVLFNDISARRNSEEALRKMAHDLSEANRLKTEFLATLAHELRNPLAPIRSGLQFIRRAPGDAQGAAGVARVHEIMERQLGHLVNLVDDLLDVARITRGQIALRRERVDLAAILSAAVETSLPLIEAARHQLDVRLPSEPLMLDADPTRLTQVVSNLLNNAARYTPKGGRIVLAAERDGDQAVVAVSDNGIGIAPEALEAVFRMFTQVGQTQQPGSGGLGIGLSLVRSLVELHGGTVQAASAGTNAGSVFTVRLPLLPPQPAAIEPAPAADLDEADRASLRVLVVDDNRDAAETLAALLNLLGHSAPVANDGHQALRMLASLMPQVMFLDLGMPGMSGYEVAAAIRQDRRYDGVRLVALTGWGGAADRERTAAAGFDRHLTKPATLEAIEEVLGAL